MNAVLKETPSKAVNPVRKRAKRLMPSTVTKQVGQATVLVRKRAVPSVPAQPSKQTAKAIGGVRESAMSSVPARSTKLPTKASRYVRKSATPNMPASGSKLERKAKSLFRESAVDPMPSAPSSLPDQANNNVRENANGRLPDLAPIIDSIRESHRQRQDFHRAEKSLTLQVRAICRRLCAGDKGEAGVLYNAMFGKGEHPQSMLAEALAGPFVQARAILEGNRKQVEKRMDGLAKKLPIYPWVESIKGFGAGSLAAVIGETGDLSNYSTHSKLWKRLGLAVIDGGRQRCVTGAAALEHGYSPSRRSIVWNVGQCVFKSQSQRVDKETGEIKTEAGFYRKLYDARKEYETPRVESKGHAHNRATRYMEKRLMRDLWKVWRKCRQGRRCWFGPEAKRRGFKAVA